MVNDPIADILTRIRNAYMARLTMLDVPYSKIKFAIAKLLEKHNYIKSVEVVTEDKKTLRIALDEILDSSLRPALLRVSKPGKRVYVKASEIRPVNNGHGIGIISTPKGVMTSYEAVSAGLGGEYLCKAY